MFVIVLSVCACVCVCTCMHVCVCVCCVEGSLWDWACTAKLIKLVVCMWFLKHVYLCFAGASVKVLVDHSEVLHGIFQDQQMKQNFAAYPELVCVDATNCWNCIFLSI